MGQDILTTGQQAILLSARRNKAITHKFYLTGGTALAHYYFHHRFSEDFDFFTIHKLEVRTIALWIQRTAKQVRATDVEFQTLNEQLVYYIHLPTEVIKIDFSYYPFEHVGSFTMDGDLKVASVRDIGVNKLHAIMTRQRGRDYVDLYEITHRGKFKLEDVINDYRIKFDMYVAPEEWAKHFAKVLDATDQPRFLGNRSWTDVEGYFLAQAKQFARQVIK